MSEDLFYSTPLHGVRSQRRLNKSLLWIQQQQRTRHWCQANCSQNIIQVKSWCGIAITHALQIDAAQITRSIVSQCIDNECVCKRVSKKTSMAIERTGELACAHNLDLVVRDADVACIIHESRGLGTGLWLDNLVEEARIECCCRHICAVSSATPQGSNEVACSFLLYDGRVAWEDSCIGIGCQAEGVGQYCALEVR